MRIGKENPMSEIKTGQITDAEMNRPSEYGGNPKQPHEVLRDMYRSDPAEPNPQ